MNCIKKHNDRTERIQLELNDKIRLELIGFVKCPGGWRGYSHSHPFWELMYINKGRATFHYRGRKYTFQPDNIYLVEPHVKHRLVNAGRDILENLYIGFSFDFHPNKISMKIRNIPIFQGAPEEAVFKNEFRKIARLLNKPELDVFKRKRGRIIEMLVKIINILIPDDKVAGEIPDARLDILTDKVKRYLSQNISRGISIDEVARPFYLSPHYLGDIFKRATGISLKSYHNTLRMTEAAVRLRENILNISELAEKLGFGGIHYFSRKFKKFYGISPVRYRQINSR